MNIVFSILRYTNDILMYSYLLFDNFVVSSVDVRIIVVSVREGTFRVTCTSSGGTVLSSSLTGPGGLNLPLQPVYTPRYRGYDTYHATTGILTGGSDGDTYHCTASNGVPAPVPSDSETLRG